MRVAITGASGYVGSSIASGFDRHGHQVISLSRRQCPTPWFYYALGDDPAGLPWNEVDVLVHAAYDFTPQTWQEALDINVIPSIALLQAAKHANVGRMIFISSMSSFEGCRSIYGKAKLMIEKSAAELGAIIIRPGLVWGERSGGGMGVLEKWVAALPIVPFPSASVNSRQYLIHQDDLSEMLVYIAAVQVQQSDKPQIVSNPLPLSLLAILRSIAVKSSRHRFFFPIPWQFAMVGLKTIEAFGINLPLRSDSLTGLVHGNPRPQMSPPPAGICYRSYP